MFLRTLQGLGEPGDGDASASDIGFGATDPGSSGGPNAIARFQFPAMQMFLDNYGNVVRLERVTRINGDNEFTDTYVVNVGTGAVTPFYGAEGWTVLDSTGRAAESDFIPQPATYSALAPFARQGPAAAPAPAPALRNYNPDIGPVYGPMTPDMAARVATLPAAISIVMPGAGAGGAGGENAPMPTGAAASPSGKWLALGLMALAAVAGSS